MSTAIAELVTFLLSADCPRMSADSVGHIVDLAERHARESADSRRMSADNPRMSGGQSADSAAERRRAYDRERRRTERTRNRADKERRSPTPPKERNSASGEADASPPASAPLRGARGDVDLLAQQNWQPVYADSRHELWGEGIPILEQLGVPLDRARRQIGRWLRDLHDDAQQVLGAIQRARDNRVIDPVPWITRALKTNGPARASPTTFASLLAEDLKLQGSTYDLRDDDDLSPTLDLRPAS